MKETHDRKRQGMKRYWGDKVQRTHDFETALSIAGGAMIVAADLGVSRQYVYKMEDFPPKHIAYFERLTGLERWKLRPDKFEAPDEKA